jgi:hypothetical protein
MPDPSAPGTLVRTSHSLTIQVNGVIVGLINGWNPTISRTITPIYQIATYFLGTRSGDPVEKVPGNVTGQTIGVQRYDIYTKRMEEAFGTSDLMMLSSQLDPFDVIEKWQYPNTVLRPGGGVEMVYYKGCWLSNIGRNFRSDGDRIVNVNATLEYTRRQLGQKG